MSETNQKYIVAAVKSWNMDLADRFAAANQSLEVKVINDKARLTHNAVKEFNPRYIFFPHWSWMIPADIYENFECIVFHMTDLPFGRGPS